jgi:O-methyltransferase
MSLHSLAFNMVNSAAASLGFGLASYRLPARTSLFSEVLDVKSKRDMLLTPLEACQIVQIVRATAKLGGAMAEVGVYRGASARLIRGADKVRPFHLFDTFAGLPEPDDMDVTTGSGRFRRGEYSCSLDNVRNYLSGGPFLSFYKGLFPATAGPVSGESFSFVHSDVDLYQSTKDVLQFFYPRMLAGGVIITHDYATAAGPRQAFDEFFDGKPEAVIELSGDQAMIAKVV